jgi:tetratricopeptide (TPR) repeat protein
MKGEHDMSGIRPWIIALLAWPAMGLAAGGGGDVGKPSDPVIAAVQEATARKDFTKAAGILQEALAKSPANADYHNLYAYAVRKGQNPDMDLVFQHYSEALRLEPQHLGAHEYIGEAYLMVGNVAKAKEHLARLDRICFFGCAEYYDLKKAIAAHEKK